MDYIRRTYGVPAKRGGRVEYAGKLGTIKSASGAYLMILLDGEKIVKPYHPTYKLKYL